MEDVITVAANLSTKGFEKGSKAMKNAINSLSRAAQSMGKSVERGAQGAMGAIKRLTPMILGVGSAYGVISKAVSAFMSQNEQLSSKMSSVWTALGNVLGPIITQIINWVTTAVSYFLSFLKLLGITGKSASELSKKAGGAASQLQKTLAGFDELNVLNDNSGGGGGGQGLEDVDPAEWMKRLAEFIKNKEWEAIGHMASDALKKVMDAFDKVAYDWGRKVGEWVQGITHALATFLEDMEGYWHKFGGSIAKFFNGLLSEWEGINFGKDLGEILAAKFAIAFEIVTGFLEGFNFERFGNIASEMIKSFFDSLSRAIDQADPRKIGQNIASFFNSIDWDGIADSVAGFLNNAWDFAITALSTFIGNVDWKSIGDGIVEFFEKIDWGKIANDIFGLLDGMWDAAVSLFSSIFGSMDANAIGTGIANFFNRINWSAIGSTIASLLSWAWNFAVSFLSSFIHGVDWRAIGEGIRAFFDGIDWKKVANDIFGLLGDAWDAAIKLFAGIFGTSGDENGVGEGIGTFFNGINWDEIGNKILEGLEKAWDAAVGLLTGFLGTASFEEVGTAIGTFFNKIPFSEIGDTLYEILRKAWNLAKVFLIGFLKEADFTGIGAAIKEFFLKLWDDKDQIANDIKEILQAAWDAACDLLTGILSEDGEDPPIVASLRKIKDVIGEVADLIDQRIIPILSGPIAEGLKNIINDGLTPILDILVDGLIDAIGDFGDILGLIQQKINGEISWGEFTSGLKDVLNGTTDAVEAGKESIEVAKENVAQYTEWAATNKSIGGSFGVVRKQINQMKTGVDSYTESLIGNMQEEDRASGAILNLRASMDELKEKYEEAINNCGSYDEAMQISADMQDELGRITSEYIQLLIDQGYGIDEIAAALGRSTEEIATQVDKEVELAEATKGAAEGGKELSDSTENMRGPMQHAQSSMSELKKESEETASGFDTDAAKIETSADTHFSEVEGRAGTFGREIGTTVGEAAENIVTQFDSGLSEMSDVAVNQTGNVNDAFSGSMSSVASNASVWGWDVLVNFNNGLVTALNNVLEPTMENIAQAIKNFIGFSEPKKGPLSNFHTFAPDMMELFTKGIYQGEGDLLDAVSSVAGNVSDAFGDMNYSIGPNMAAMSAIGANVPFQVPTVAGGGILPYSISGGAGVGDVYGNADVIGAVDRLNGAIESLQYSLENMQWVAQFGDLRALANAIRKEDRKMSRAGGR